MKISKFTPTQYAIIGEISKAVQTLGGGLELLGAIGSWGDTLPDDHVLDMLKYANVKFAAPPTTPNAL